MSVWRRVPLAWKNLTESPWRLLASVAGTAFAVVLMFSQLGFRNALLDNMTSLIRHLDGDLFLIQRERYMMSTPAAFPRRRLDLVASDPRVASAHAFYLEVRPTARWRNVDTGFTRHIRLLAFEPGSGLFDLPEVRAQRDAWSAPDTALADARSKRMVFGPMELGTVSELNDRRIAIVGTFALGTDFRSNGTLLLSEANFLRYTPARLGASWGDTLIDVGVVRLEAGVDPAAAQAAIEPWLTPDVRIQTKAGLIEKERRFWENVAPIGVVFDIGLVMGFVVGMAICYQVLFAEISDRLAEFATLKAMGYGNASLLRTIVLEGIYLAILGFVVGLGVSLLLFRWLEGLTGLDMRLDPTGTLVILALTVIMCVLSGGLAARRLRSADPAELFG